MDFDTAGYDEDSYDEFANDTLDVLFEAGRKRKVHCQRQTVPLWLGG